MGNKKKRIFLGILIGIIIIALGAGMFLYRKIFSPFFDIKETTYIYIDERKDYQDLLLQLETSAKIKDIKLFEYLSSTLEYPDKMKSGRYAVKPGMNCKEFLSVLLNGLQTPVKLTFNNVRLKQDLAERIGQQLMLESADLLVKLEDSAVCTGYGFDPQTIIGMFIPNTYEIYWNTSVDQFLLRMKKEYDRFWTEERKKKADNIPLSLIQVSVLASIVEEETAVKSEFPVVSGLYINRLKKGMLLQADPTVKFAVGDFTIRRVLYSHLETDSPYNTYIYSGLPPGPIRIPSIAAIDGVLNHAKHNYLYMCAKEDFSGKHNFATTMAEHSRNADRYRAALNRNNIR